MVPIKGKDGCKGPRGLMVLTSQLHLYFAKVDVNGFNVHHYLDFLWCFLFGALASSFNDDEDDSLSLSQFSFQNVDSVNISDVQSFCCFHCNPLWYFTPLTDCLKCLKCFSCTSNSFDSSMMEALMPYSTLMRCGAATANDLTVWGRSCDADPSGIMLLKLILSADWYTGSTHFTCWPLSIITGWRRPYLINWDVPTGMIGINFLAVYITSAAWWSLSAIDSKDFNTHSWTSDRVFCT